MLDLHHLFPHGRAALAIALVAAAGAAGAVDAPASGADAEARCRAWHQALAAEVDAAGLRDAYGVRLPSFPHLRTDRFLASFASEPLSGDRLEAWWGHLYATQARALAAELAGLPPPARARVDLARTRLGPDEASCGSLLLRGDTGSSASRARLLDEAARVPSEYSLSRRALGLYPVSALGVAFGVQAWQARTRAQFREAPALASPHRRYEPPAPMLPPRGLREGLAGLERDALGVPRLPADVRALLRTYAPALEVEQGGGADRIGRVEWGEDGRPDVAAESPTAYAFVSHARVGARVLLQMNYVFWFPERPCVGMLDILCGRLDGLHWRVTLGPDGRPWVADAIHPCGCYHLFFPTPRARAREAPPTLEEFVFVAQPLPDVAIGDRVVLRVQASTHYLVRVDVEPAAADGRAPAEGRAGSREPYALEDYATLRALPTPGGGRRSLFGADGIVAGTQRLERVLLWPTGVPSPGAMRQYGRHATAFVGERHFDDPRLLDERFELVETGN